MFTESIVGILCSVVNADSSATDAEKSRLTELIVNATASDAIPFEDKVVSFAEAARILGRKNPQTARNMAKSGLLKSVYGTGTQRAIGVTYSSLRKILSEGCKK